MGRSVPFNKITSPEKIQQILPLNKELLEDFLVYLKSMDRSPNTIAAYRSDLLIFFCYNLDYNNNKSFIDLSKRDFIRFQNHAINEYQWSPNRLRRVKSVISSLSNYIENILDDEYPNYRNLILKIDSPAKRTVQEPSIFEEDELKKLLDNLVEKGKIRWAAMLALGMYSGRRKTELTLFKISYFNEENTIFDMLWKTDEKIRTKGPGIEGKQMPVYVLKDKFKPYLDLWIQYRKEHNIESEWLFPNMNDYSKHITVESLKSCVPYFTDFLGKPFYWHSMRHFFVTMLAKQDVPDSVIQDIIGWESADMVKLYKDLTNDENIGKFFMNNTIK